MTRRRLSLADGYGMPPHKPYYSPLPTQYRNVRFQMLYFRADPDRVATVIPEPFEPSSDGLCVAFTIEVPFCSDYGPFSESGFMERVIFDGKPGYYTSHVYLDNVKAIVSGRERWGTPKEFADVELRIEGGALTGTTTVEGLTLMTMRTEMGEPASEDDMMPMFPSYRLKIIPKADGPGFSLKQVVSVGPTEATTHALFKGTGSLGLHPAVDWDLAALEPVDTLDAFYSESSYEETYGEVVYEVRADARLSGAQNG